MPIAKRTFVPPFTHIPLSPISNLHPRRRRLLFFHSSNSMDTNNQTETVPNHVHYNHTDPSKYARWNARESFEFMYARPWQRLNQFYLNTVRGNFSYPLPIPFVSIVLNHRSNSFHPLFNTATHQHHQHHNVPPSFFPFSNTRVSISPPNDYSDEHLNNWSCDSPPLTSPSFINGGPTTTNYTTSVTALSEDNERLRRSNNMLMSELAHMKKLYNDIIYFVQNHVKPVAPSNSYSSSYLLPHASSNPNAINGGGNVSMMQRPMNQINSTNPKHVTQFQHQTQSHHQHHHGVNVNVNVNVNSPTTTSRSSITMVEGHKSNNYNCSKTKLFGVSLQSKKRVHPECGSNSPTNLETNKTRLVLDQKDDFDFDLGLNLMPPSTC